MKQLLFFVLTVSLFACNQTRIRAKTELSLSSDLLVDSVQSAIEKELASHVNGALQYNWQQAAAVFDSNATFIRYGSASAHVTGKKQLDSIEQAEVGAFQKQQLKADVKWQTHSLMVDGDMAYHISFVNAKMWSPGNDTIKAKFDMIMTWKRQTDKTWKIHTWASYPQ